MDLAPNLVALVPKRILNRRSVQEALVDRKWVTDTRGALSIVALVEYLELWEMLDDVQLQQDMLDQHTWRLSSSGIYSSKSEYLAFFVGTIKYAPWKMIWKCCAFEPMLDNGQVGATRAAPSGEMPPM